MTQKIRKLSFTLFKTDSGEFIVRDMKKLNRALDSIAPGRYVLLIEQDSDRLSKLKKYYFVMEEGLGKHLGYRKSEIHEATKAIFRKADPKGSGEEDGMVYDSVADIKHEEVMYARILAFQDWAAREFDYKFEPFTE